MEADDQYRRFPSSWEPSHGVRKRQRGEEPLFIEGVEDFLGLVDGKGLTETAEEGR